MTSNRSRAAPTRRDVVRSLGLCAAGGLGATSLGRGTGAASAGRVRGEATTLTLLPSSEDCIDPPAGATADEAWDGDCEDTSAAAADADADRKRHHAQASAMPDHDGTTLDAWFIADQTPRLPADLSTALDIRKELPEYPGEEFRQYRIRNHLEASFPSSDGRTIDDWSAVRVESNEDHPPSHVLVEGEPGEDNALRDLIESAPDVPEPEVQALFDELEGAEMLPATTTVYADHADGRPASEAHNRFSVDGVEGVRVTQIYGGADTYVLLLSEIYEALRDRYGPVTADRKFREYTGVAFEAIPAFLVTPPTMYTFLDLAVAADGARAVRVRDASPYPKHYLYAGEPLVDETRFEEGGLLDLGGTVHGGDWHPREDTNEGPFARWVAEAQTAASPFPPAERAAYEVTTPTPTMRWTADGSTLSGERLALALAAPQYPWE